MSAILIRRHIQIPTHVHIHKYSTFYPRAIYMKSCPPALRLRVWVKGLSDPFRQMQSSRSRCNHCGKYLSVWSEMSGNSWQTTCLQFLHFCKINLKMCLHVIFFPPAIVVGPGFSFHRFFLIWPKISFLLS